MQVKSVQPTPNPNAFKFVLDQKVASGGVRNYTTADQARGDAVATALYVIPGVDTLFFCDNFVTVSMQVSADWRAVHDEVVKTLNGFEGVAVMPPPTAVATTAPATTAAPLTTDSELLARINELLDDRVRPALAGDGGGLEVVGLEGKTLRIRYQGACGSCPSSIAGTLAAIQNLVQSEIDEGLSVVAA